MTAADPDGDLEVHFIDVGQGDATLLVAPDATVLVDAGRHDRSDVMPYLVGAGVDTLDLVAITHPHADHLGQFEQVIRGLDVAEVWWSGSTHTTQTFDRALAALEDSGAAYEEPRSGDATALGSLTIDILNPPSDHSLDDLHDAGLAMRITYGDVRFLFTGDAEAGTERRMVDADPDLVSADVYQVGHHGSQTSTSQPFLDAMAPQIAVYSAGDGNQYGHPHAEVIDRLADASVAVYGTDVHGSLVITTDGDQISVHPEPDELLVAGAGSGPSPEPAPDPEPEPTANDAPPSPADGDCLPEQVDINAADFEELQRIHQVGPDRAAQIIDLRPFSSMSALERVSGIGPVYLQQIRDEGIACA